MFDEEDEPTFTRPGSKASAPDPEEDNEGEADSEEAIGQMLIDAIKANDPLAAYEAMKKCK